jgi:hypothetical protein
MAQIMFLWADFVPMRVGITFANASSPNEASEEAQAGNWPA